MKKKETPSSVDALREGAFTSAQRATFQFTRQGDATGKMVAPSDCFGQVSYYAGKGVKLSVPCSVSGKPPLAKRGKVGGFSQAARRRMRHFLLSHSAPVGWSVCGATFTIPGHVLPDDLERAIWKWFCREVERKGWGMVWRLELQKRGARHFHALCILPDSVSSHNVMVLWHAALRSIGSVSYSEDVEPLRRQLFKHGRPVLDRLGNPVYRDYRVKSVSSLMAHPGAYEYSCKIESDGGRGAWMRYLSDHATKSKTEQIAVGKGRHWGVVGRARFVSVLPDHVQQLDETAYYRFLRVYRRLCQSSKKASCVFGRKLGKRPRFGLFGQTVKFSRPETVKRLADWAVSVQDWGGKL